MTPGQTQKLKNKIAGIKRTLASEKKKFGCYDDSRGLRYLPAGYFVQLGEYAGGLAYLNWFDKNFPDDGGFPEFLFESAILLFKTGRRKEAGKKAFQTYCSNPYWIDRFFGLQLTPLDIWHSSNLMTIDYTQSLAYSSKQPELADFSEWLKDLIMTEDFTYRCGKYVDIFRQLKTETDKERRRFLVMEASQLME